MLKKASIWRARSREAKQFRGQKRGEDGTAWLELKIMKAVETLAQYTPGIKMHQFPSDPVTRKKWIEFVRRHRPTFPDDPKPSASLCSAHFEDVCYARNPFVQIPGMENIKFNKTLIRGALPTRDTVFPSGPPALTTRSKRRVSSTKSQSSSDCLACEGTYPDCWRVLYSNFMVYTGW